MLYSLAAYAPSFNPGSRYYSIIPVLWINPVPAALSMWTRPLTKIHNPVSNATDPEPPYLISPALSPLMLAALSSWQRNFVSW